MRRHMAPHPTPKTKRASSAAANSRGNSGEGEGLRTPIKEEPVDEDTVGSTTVAPMPSPGEARTSRRSLEEVVQQLKTEYSEEEILERLQRVSTPTKTLLPSTPVAESTTSTCPNDWEDIPGSGASGARLSPARSLASTASICSTPDVIVLDDLDSDEEQSSNRGGTEATASTETLNASEEKPPLGRTMVVPKTEPPEFIEPDNNPTNESADSGRYECATDGPSSAASKKVGLSKDCQNNAAAMEPSTVVEKKQQQGSSSTSFSPDKAIANIMQAYLLHQLSTPGSSRMTPTMSREASGSAQTTQATSKREMTANESPGSATKRLRMEDSTASANISQQQLVGVIPAHQAAIVAVKIDGDFVYSSSGQDVKRHCLKDPRMCVEYRGSTGEVRSLEVWRPPKKPLQPGALYTASQDGHLRCYNAESGELTATFLSGAAITCSALAWNTIYLGLENGFIHVFNVKTKEYRESFRYLDAPVRCITAAIGGRKKEKFFCVVSSEGEVVICSGSSNGKLWWLPGSVHQSPPCVGINRLVLYLTAPGQMVQMHDLQEGHKQKSFEVKCEAMGIRFHDNYAIICSAGGTLCFYRTRDFTCEVEYYTGGSTVKCIDVNGPVIATGDSGGNLQILYFDKSKFCSCKIQSCGLKFVRQDNLQLHLALAHNMIAR